MVVIKYWAIYHNLSGSEGNRKEVINNYAVSLLVIFYLQNCEQILPSVKKLQHYMNSTESVMIKNLDGIGKCTFQCKIEIVLLDGDPLSISRIFSYPK